MSNKVLSNKDVNATMTEQQTSTKDVKSMEYHRQVFQSKIAEDDSYVTRSDFLIIIATLADIPEIGPTSTSLHPTTS